jgi:prepilin-type N-terminal cleavage/methylation domain-containing protein/prepilin-type processing-associated H-X9-DG protein
MNGIASGNRPRGFAHRAFTLTELLTVIGLIALLVSLFLPVLGRMRSAAAAATCLSNLRQMGTGWMMYTAENGGKLMYYVSYNPATPDLAWTGAWPGVLDKQAVRGHTLLCPSAFEPTLSDVNRGYGTATHAWTGRYSQNGTAVRLNATTYRDGSYGFNIYLTSGGGFGPAGGAVSLAAVNNPSNVPAFMDCAFVDVSPLNGLPTQPVPPPPNLHGEGIAPGQPDHWNFLLARHSRGINVYMADGSARWVRLDDLYLLTWKKDWVPYRLPLPAH